jgi:hypothetical protein
MQISKSALGAVFNVHHSLAEVILGIPPLLVTNRVNTTKHLLKLISQQPQEYDDPQIQFVTDELKDNQNHVLKNQLKEVFRFLEWKLTQSPDIMTPTDVLIIKTGQIEKFSELSRKSCHYSHTMMKRYTEKLWQESITNQLNYEGWATIPRVSTENLKFPRGTSREEEVKVMSLFYKNNLLNAFLFTTQKKQCESPLCVCGLEEQTAFHILTNCQLVEDDVRQDIINRMLRWNDVPSEDELHSDAITALNCSRDPAFIRMCVEVINTESLQLRSKIKLK